MKAKNTSNNNDKGKQKNTYIKKNTKDPKSTSSLRCPPPTCRLGQHLEKNIWQPSYLPPWTCYPPWLGQDIPKGYPSLGLTQCCCLCALALLHVAVELRVRWSLWAWSRVEPISCQQLSYQTGSLGQWEPDLHGSSCGKDRHSSLVTVFTGVFNSRNLPGK